MREDEAFPRSTEWFAARALGLGFSAQRLGSSVNCLALGIKGLVRAVALRKVSSHVLGFLWIMLVCLIRCLLTYMGATCVADLATGVIS